MSSKFTIKVELQGLKIEVEGSREDVPRLAAKVGEQFGNLIKPALLLEAGNGTSHETNGSEPTTKSRGGRKRAGAGGAKTAGEEINFTIDPIKYGSPNQEWTTAQKAIWFLYVLKKNTDKTQLTGYSIAKNFNKYFRSAGAINGGNVNKGLDKERLKGTGATVGVDMSSGAAQFYLATAGEALAESLIRGDSTAE